MSSNGVSINFTSAAGGSPVQAYLVYLYNAGGVNQLAAVLPSTVSPGSYNVTVTNGAQTSFNFQVQVVASKPGVVTQDSTGDGLAVVQNYVSATELDIDRYTTGTVNGTFISPAHPGQTLTAWATGLGPVPFADNTAPNGGQGYNFLAHGASVTVYVGGMAISGSAIAYAGRAPCCAGEDQIDFTLPANVPTGCFEPFQISINGNVSQVAVLSVAPAGAGACVSSQYTTAQLQAFDNGGSVDFGFFTLLIFPGVPGLESVSSYDALGVFASVSGLEAAGSANAPPTPPPGTCSVTQNPSNVSTTVAVTSTELDAGTVTLSGPSGSSLNNTPLPIEGGAGVLPAGVYTLKGGGGKDVGPFSATLTLGPQYAITGAFPTTVNRSAGLTLSWTGGNSTDSLAVIGASTASSGNSASFACYAIGGAGTFTIPPSILNQLPAGTGELLFSGGRYRFSAHR
jgi:uncharacterized protein (TIGR03437 family)